MFLGLGNMLRAFKMWLVFALYGINVIFSFVFISQRNAKYWRPSFANKTKNLLLQQIKHIASRRQKVTVLQK